MKKKQIVFVEQVYSIPAYKLARTLKLKENYELILILFNKVDKEAEKFLYGAYDKIILFDIGDVRNLSFSNWKRIIKLFFSKDHFNFRSEIKKLKPYIVQFTGPELNPALSMFLFRKFKRIYFSHDIWKPYFKKISLKKDSGRMLLINRLVEYFCFKYSDGVLHKGPKEELINLKIKTKGNDLQYLSGCFDEWIIKPNEKNKYFNEDKEFHLVYAGRPWVSAYGHSSYLDVIKIITDQEIHFHIFSPSINFKDKKEFLGLETTNPYFHLHEELRGKNLNEELAKFDFGIIPDFIDYSKIRKEFMAISLATKIFTYFESGIPIIVSRDLEFTSEIVELEKSGISINYSDLKNLRKILSSLKLTDLKKNVVRAQEDFKTSNIVENIVSFYDKIHSLN
jgi:hypothetical protein